MAVKISYGNISINFTKDEYLEFMELVLIDHLSIGTITKGHYIKRLITKRLKEIKKDE